MGNAVSQTNKQTNNQPSFRRSQGLIQWYVINTIVGFLKAQSIYIFNLQIN